MRHPALGAGLALAALLGTAPASAKVIHVVYAPGTPLQDAINAAAPGDTVKMDSGFSEAIVIDKPLKLKGPSYTDAGCISGPTLRVLADGVSIQRVFFYGGGTPTVEVAGRTGFKMSGGSAFPGSYDVDCPGSRDYGILIQASTHVRLTNLTSPVDDDAPGGYGIAWIALRDIPPAAHVKVSGLFSNRPHAVGILAENVSGGPGDPPAVVVSHSRLLQSGTGIALHGADGLTLLANQIHDCAGAGIDLDGNSDGNLVTKNVLSGNTPDVRDLGTGNCWSKNRFTTGTVSPCP